MGKTIAIVNHKGGVGKTTTTASVGVALANKGYRVLLIDLDAQANLTTSLSTAEPDKTIYHALKGEALPIRSLKDRLDMVCSSLEMAGVELELSARMSREFILKDLIDEVKSNYDCILLDCPPSLGLVTLNALVATDEVIVPLTAEALPAKGLAMLTDIIAMAQKRLNSSLSISGLVLTRWKRNNLSQAVEEQLREIYGAKLFNTKIRENIKIAESPLSATDIISHAPTSNGAKDYQSLTEEIISRYLNGTK